MASHLRRQIREGLTTAITGLSTTGARVFTSRVYPLEVSDLPGLLVTSQSEIVDADSYGVPRPLQRRLRLEVRAIAQAAADLDDTLDQICKEVEIALAMPCAALAGLCKSITLLGTDIGMSDGAEQPRGSAAMAFEVYYVAAENAPDVAL